MIRIVIENVLLFLLPTALYLLYATVSRANGDTKRKPLDDAPLLWLFAAGAALVVLVLVAFGNVSGGLPTDGYTPPSFEGGKLKPGVVQ
jgi:hypothetical protein